MLKWLIILFLLCCTAGVILHFNLPVIKEYYVVNPQRWFDLCALVISPNNVSNLVRCGRPGGKSGRGTALETHFNCLGKETLYCTRNNYVIT